MKLFHRSNLLQGRRWNHYKGRIWGITLCKNVSVVW